jgi:lipopolysaccharide transport system permease protein
MIARLIDSRELTWRLFLRDFSARYRQSALGYAWAVVSTLVTVATFTWLSRSRVLPIQGTTLPYPLFLMLNLTVWQFFASGITAATQSLVNAGSLITKINFPRETLVLASVGQAIFDLMVRLVLLAAGFAFFTTAPHPAVLLLPLLMVPLCFWVLGLGFFLALLNGIMRDAGYMITFLLNFAMFLTPVVYPLPKTHAALLAWNPLTPFLVAAQDLATIGRLTNPQPIIISSLVGLVVMFVSWRVFSVTGPRIAERV